MTPTPTEDTKFDIDYIFDRTSHESVEFEILFVSLLATTLLSVSGRHPGIEQTAVTFAIISIFVTLLRRMALNNPLSHVESIMEISRTVLFISSVFAVVYISTILVYQLPLHFYRYFYIITGIIILTIVFSAVIVHEIIFRDFLLWGALLLYNKHVETHEPLSTKLLDLSHFANRVSLAPETYVPDELTDVSTSNKTPISENAGLGLIAPTILAIFAFVLLLSFAAGSVLYFVTGSVFAESSGIILLMISIVPLMGIVEFWYARYGNAQFTDLTGAKNRFLAMSVSLLVTVVANPEVTTSPPSLIRSLLRV